tara:strand:- start:20 stop:718 length:699 start_codon:yes stop_codon:yes gene_type:complete
MMMARLSYLLALSSAAALAPGPLLHHRVMPAQSASARSAVSMAGFGAAKPAGGKGKAGFGSKGKAPKKKELVSPKRQWDSYTRITEAGVKPIKVFARDTAADGDVWMLVGNVAIDAADGSAEQAAQYQKRLILEHAARLSPRLKVAQVSLEDSNPNPDANPSPSPNPSPNPKQATLDTGLEVLGEPAKLVKPDNMPESLTCGFLGASAPPSARPRAAARPRATARPRAAARR